MVDTGEIRHSDLRRLREFAALLRQELDELMAAHIDPELITDELASANIRRWDLTELGDRMDGVWDALNMANIRAQESARASG